MTLTWLMYLHPWQILSSIELHLDIRLLTSFSWVFHNLKTLFCFRQIMHLEMKETLNFATWLIQDLVTLEEWDHYVPSRKEKKYLKTTSTTWLMKTLRNGIEFSITNFMALMMSKRMILRILLDFWLHHDFFFLPCVL